jgi:uncharacterized protein involved in exopolysaccharide biosynthesis
MSRIEEALKRVARKATAQETVSPVLPPEPRSAAHIDRYPFEQRPGPTSHIHEPGGPDDDVDHDPDDSSPLIDLQQLINYAFFVLGALRRRKWTVLATFVLTMAATTAAVLLWPKTYHVQAKLLANRNDIMAALSNPGRAIPREADAPTRAAAETVLRRENLLSLVKQTNLVNEWSHNRAPILRVKDAVFKRLYGKPSDDETLDALVGLLEKQIVVAVGNEGTVTIDIDWPDARLAYELVESALQNFLEGRQVAETSAIADSVSILERYASSLESDINTTVGQMRVDQAKRPVVDRSRTISSAPSRTAAPPVVSIPDFPTAGAPELGFRVNRLKTALDSKRQEITRLEDFRRQQLSEVQTQLAAALAIYTEGHPAVASLRQSVASLARESPQLQALRAEARGLETDYEAAAGAQLAEEQKLLVARRAATVQAETTTAKSAASKSLEPVAPAPPRELDLMGTGVETANPTNVHLRMQLSQLGDIRERLESARIELATSQAGFKYRYSVIRPAQVPRRPVKPNVLAIVLAGALGAIFLSIFAAVGSDLLSDTLLEPWQMESMVGAPVLLRLKQW